MNAPEREAGAAAAAEPVFELRLPARPGLLKLIRATVGEAAREIGFSDAGADELVVAVDEACQNIIRYAYKGDAAGEIVLRFVSDGDRVVVRLIDFADPVDPDKIKPRPLGELRPGGLGTRLIAESVDEMEFETPEEGTGNVLRLVKRVR